MNADEWLRLGQLIVAAAGFIAVVVTIRQKTSADNRAEWWRRYTWAEEKRNTAEGDDEQILGWEHLRILTMSPLATRTEARIIQLIAIRDALNNNEGQEEKEESDNVD